MIPRISISSIRRIRALSVVELLVVMVVLIVLLSLAAPAVLSPLRGSNLNRAGQIVGDQIALARQEALTRNREVQVRFYHWPSGLNAGWRGVQVWRVEMENGDLTEVPVSRLQKLPDGIAISDQSSLSPLLDADNTIGGQATIGNEKVHYVGFRFRPGGGTDSSVTATNNFLTLHAIEDKSSPPANFYTLQVDPLTGKVSVFRP